jgi:hypothetical protein
VYVRVQRDLDGEVFEVHIPTIMVRYYVVHTDRFVHYLGFAASVSEARRLREAGAVEIDGVRITTPQIAFIFDA